jgi:hypothetical protein
MSKTCVRCFKSNAKPSDASCPNCGAYFTARETERAPLLASHRDEPDAPPPSYSETIPMPVVPVRPARQTAITDTLGDEPEVMIKSAPAPTGPDFVESRSFNGIRPGYTYKRGAHGVGYYRDRGPYVQTQPARVGYGKPSDDQDFGGKQTEEYCIECLQCCCFTSAAVAVHFCSSRWES